MDEDNLISTSDDDLEKLFQDVEPEQIESAVKEATGSAAVEPEDQGGDGSPPDTKSDKSGGDLRVALKQERERIQQERERRVAAEARLEMLEQMLKGQKEDGFESSIIEDEPDPYLETDQYVQFHKERTKQELTTEIAKIEARMQGELIRSKISMDEALLEKSGELDEYRELVNLSDPEHFFAKYVAETPKVLDKIYAHPRPAWYAKELAKNVRAMSDPTYAKAQQDKLEADAEARALRKLLEKIKSKSANVSGAVGLADVSSSTGSGKKDNSNWRRLSDADLEKLIYEDD